MKCYLVAVGLHTNSERDKKLEKDDIEERIDILAASTADPARIGKMAKLIIKKQLSNKNYRRSYLAIFITHLVAALDRSIRQVGDPEPPDAVMVSSVVAAQPNAVNETKILAESLAAAFNINLSRSEMDYLIIHFGTLEETKIGIERKDR